MDVPIKAKVECADGVAGRCEAVIVDPRRRSVTHFVLRDHGWPHIQRLVPVSLIAWTTEDDIHLGCSVAEAWKQEPFLETEFVEAHNEDVDVPLALSYGSMYLWPFAYPHERVPVTHQRVPYDEIVIRRGAQVDATDGPVGKVEAFLVDAEDDRITHVVVRSGHLLRREFAIPVSDVRISDTCVGVRRSRREIEELPHVPYHAISLLPGVETSDGELAAVSPEEIGMDRGRTDASRVEAAHLLANDAMPRLEARGFSREQILEWAEQYTNGGRNGGVSAFVDWIGREEHAVEPSRSGTHVDVPSSSDR